MKREKKYWVVARKPGEDFRSVLMSHYKPHYLKSVHEWQSASGDDDWCIVPVWLFGDVFVKEKYYEPRKVVISTEFLKSVKKP